MLRWVLFDLNGTLVDPVVMAQPLGDSAGDEELILTALDEANHQAWVLTLAGVQRPFKELFDAAIRRRLALAGRDPGAAEDALALLSSMPAYLDAPAALEQLRGVGLRLGVLTQSAAEAADAVLGFSGLRDRIEMVLSAPESGAFKPDPRPYRMAVERTGALPDEVGFVAAHWWDVAGAKHAGLRTGWVARRDLVLPGSVPEPDVSGRDLAEVCDGLARLAA
jgi:2-haloacid dehalogenase